MAEKKMEQKKDQDPNKIILDKIYAKNKEGLKKNSLEAKDFGVRKIREDIYAVYRIKDPQFVTMYTDKEGDMDYSVKMLKKNIYLNLIMTGMGYAIANEGSAKRLYNIGDVKLVSKQNNVEIYAPLPGRRPIDEYSIDYYKTLSEAGLRYDRFAIGRIKTPDEKTGKFTPVGKTSFDTLIALRHLQIKDVEVFYGNKQITKELRDRYIKQITTKKNHGGETILEQEINDYRLFNIWDSSDFKNRDIITRDDVDSYHKRGFIDTELYSKCRNLIQLRDMYIKTKIEMQDETSGKTQKLNTLKKGL